MSHISKYIERILNEAQMSYLDDLLELYAFVQDRHLRRMFATFHTQLNKWFNDINTRIRTGIDKYGEIAYQGGYFHAQDSRDYLALIDHIDNVRSQLSDTEYAFKLADEDYSAVIKVTRTFVVKSGGSYIPEGFSPIKIKELTPIFQLADSIEISNSIAVVNARLKLIGKGSYAQVLSYIDPHYNISVAVKRANKDLNSKEIERFKQEFEVLKSLSSPYIVEVYSYDDKKNEYTMECMDENINKYILRVNSTLTLSKRKNIIMQICNGLKYMHSKNILHRDISLTNVFVKHYEDRDVVKIGDFGLVKIPESNLTSIMTEFKGSLNDPDLINVGFRNYEMCHETYALTRLCFFILTGKTNANNQKDGAIKQFWLKGTSPRREERFQDVDEVLDAVRII